jgi:hypothetical protein
MTREEMIARAAAAVLRARGIAKPDAVDLALGVESAAAVIDEVGAYELYEVLVELRQETALPGTTYPVDRRADAAIAKAEGR